MHAIHAVLLILPGVLTAGLCDACLQLAAAPPQVRAHGADAPLDAGFALLKGKPKSGLFAVVGLPDASIETDDGTTACLRPRDDSSTHGGRSRGRRPPAGAARAS